MEKISFDKNVAADVTNVKFISVQSQSINVKLWRSSTKTLQVRLHGEVATNGMPYAELEVDGTACNVNAGIAGGSWKGKVHLDIMLPEQEFSQLAVESRFGSITLNVVPKAEQLRLQTNNQAITFLAAS